MYGRLIRNHKEHPMKIEGKLKPCPFCGNSSIIMSNRPDENGYWFMVSCPYCSASTTEFSEPIDAAFAWNQRHSPYPNRVLTSYRKSTGRYFLSGMVVCVVLLADFYFLASSVWPWEDDEQTQQDECSYSSGGMSDE